MCIIIRCCPLLGPVPHPPRNGHSRLSALTSKKISACACVCACNLPFFTSISSIERLFDVHIVSPSFFNRPVQPASRYTLLDRLVTQQPSPFTTHFPRGPVKRAFKMSPEDLSIESLDTITLIERLCSALSLLGCAFIGITFLSSTAFRKPINRLVFYACIGNVFTNVGTLIARSAIPSTNSFLCQFQGFLIQMYVVV